MNVILELLSFLKISVLNWIRFWLLILTSMHGIWYMDVLVNYICVTNCHRKVSNFSRYILSHNSCESRVCHGLTESCALGSHMSAIKLLAKDFTGEGSTPKVTPMVCGKIQFLMSCWIESLNSSLGISQRPSLVP